jgi:2,5-diketo-D-gluconate reductase B
MHKVSSGGVEIPALGFGTWQVDGPGCVDMVRQAVEIGYRHIDTAAAYGNEAEVGRGLRDAGLPREDIFLTTKIWNDAHKAGDLQRAAEDSLRKLQLDYVDLLLIHWPVPAVPLEETITALNEVKRRGLARAIGVSNFPSALVEKAAQVSEAPLATDQVEYHPYLSQKTLLGALRRHGMSLTAYSPLARGKLLDEPVLKTVAQAHGKSVGQAALRWLVQQDGVIAIPKTNSAERARQNLEIFDFELTPDEMAQISALARPNGRVIDPGFAPDWDLD